MDIFDKYKVSINDYLQKHKASIVLNCLLSLLSNVHLVKLKNIFIYLCILKFIYFIYLFLAVLGLCCCARAFSGCSQQGLLFVEVCRLLTAAASLVVEHGLQARGLQQLWHAGFSSCGTWAQQLWLSGSRVQPQQLWRMAWAQLLCVMWDLPGPGLEPMSPALEGGFLTTAPRGKPTQKYFMWCEVQ